MSEHIHHKLRALHKHASKIIKIVEEIQAIKEDETEEPLCICPQPLIRNSHGDNCPINTGTVEDEPSKRTWVKGKGFINKDGE